MLTDKDDFDAVCPTYSSRKQLLLPEMSDKFLKEKY